MATKAAKSTKSLTREGVCDRHPAHSPIFKPEASRAREGMALIYDIAGFSPFFNQPDVHSYIPRYLNHVSKCIDTIIFGGKPVYESNLTYEPLDPLPDHRKFLGDGALHVWAPESSASLTERFTIKLSNRLWNMQKSYRQVNNACADDIPICDLPVGVRFGLARGTVFELSVVDSSEKEYVGICLNLASRLQKYCPGLNYIASARVNLQLAMLKRHGYVKVVATKIKGFPKEIVVVDKGEYSQLDKETRSALFADLPPR